MSDDARQSRHRAARDARDAARVERTRPEPSSAFAPFMAGYPGQPQLGAAPVILPARSDRTPNRVATYPAGQYPFFAGSPTDANIAVTFVDAPPVATVPAVGFPGPGLRRVARLASGRWVAMTGYCPCGPCHPQRTLTVNADYLRTTKTVAGGVTSFATDRASVSAAVPWGGAYAWTAAVPTASLLTATESFGVGFCGLLGISRPELFGAPPGTNPTLAGWQPGGYTAQRWTLACDDGGYTLTIAMRATGVEPGTGSNGGISRAFTLGYNLLYRGTLASCVPLLITFGDEPESAQVVDAVRTGNGSISTTYAEYIPGVGATRTPRLWYYNPNFTFGNGAGSDATGPHGGAGPHPWIEAGDTVSGPVDLQPAEAFSMTPKFGIYSLSVTG